jgi:hypothetical protein
MSDLIFPKSEYRIEHAQRFIYDQFGHATVLRPAPQLKFGLNSGVGASFATIQTFPGSEVHETYVASDLITHISSGNAADTEEVSITGFTLSGGNFTRVEQVVTLVGQTKTALTTPLARVERVSNNNGNELVGVVYVYEDVAETNGVPDTDTAVHIMIPAGDQQSFKASLTLASDEYYLITQMAMSVDKKTNASIDVRLESRQFGKVFKPMVQSSASTTGTGTVPAILDPVGIMFPNSDVRLVASASTTNVSVSGWMNGYIAKVVT